MRQIIETWENISIREWQECCEKVIREKMQNAEVLEQFHALAVRKKDRTCNYLIRNIEDEDLGAVLELINRNFDMNLTEYDKEDLEPFMQSGYSFVVCREEEVLGVVLGYCVPELTGQSVYIDTLVVGETVRNQGLSSMLLSHVMEIASKKHIHIIKLQTDKEIKAYEIYKHLGFIENKCVPMKRYFI